MAKDSKGHGSNAGWTTSRLGAGYMATHNRTGTSVRGDNPKHLANNMRDAEAADALHAGNSKTGKAEPVHSAMGGGSQPSPVASAHMSGFQRLSFNEAANSIHNSGLRAAKIAKDAEDWGKRRKKFRLFGNK